MNGFAPHGVCYAWDPTVLWLHVVGNGSIAASYIAIAVMLSRYLAHVELDAVTRLVTWLFAGFIACCGLGHVLALVVIWHPVYRAEGYWLVVTATVSTATAGVLGPAVERVLRALRAS